MFQVAIIEGDPPTSHQLKQWILSAKPGITVEQWFTRDAAEAAIAREDYDLVVLDIELGRERHAGVAIINAINKSGRNRDNIRKHISTIRDAFRELDEDFDRIENIPMRGFCWLDDPPAGIPQCVSGVLRVPQTWRFESRVFSSSTFFNGFHFNGFLSLLPRFEVFFLLRFPGSPRSAERLSAALGANKRNTS